jgi:hypothetical protein
MISAYQEMTIPKVRPPVANGEDKVNEFALKSRQGSMAWCDGSTEE